MQFESNIKAGCSAGSKEWTDGRKNTIGASEINSLLFGFGPFCPKRKITLFKKALGINSSNEKYLRFSLGHFFEEITKSYVLCLFEEYGTFIMEEKRYLNDDMEHYSCTPDFVGTIKTDRLRQIFADTHIHEFLSDKEYQNIIFEFKYALSPTSVIDNALSHSYHKTYLPQMALEQYMFGKEVDFCIYARLNCSMLIPSKITDKKLEISAQITSANGEFTSTKINNSGCILYFLPITRDWIQKNKLFLRKLYPYVDHDTYIDIYSLTTSLFKKENLITMLTILSEIKPLFAESLKFFDTNYDISSFLGSFDEFNETPYLIVIINDITIKFDFMSLNRVKHLEYFGDSLTALTDEIQDAKLLIKNALSKDIGQAYSELRQIYKKLKEVEPGINLNDTIINHYSFANIEERMD